MHGTGNATAQRRPRAAVEVGDAIAGHAALHGEVPGGEVTTVGRRTDAGHRPVDRGLQRLPRGTVPPGDIVDDAVAGQLEGPGGEQFAGRQVEHAGDFARTAAVEAGPASGREQRDVLARLAINERERAADREVAVGAQRDGQDLAIDRAADAGPRGAVPALDAVAAACDQVAIGHEQERTDVVDAVWRERLPRDPIPAGQATCRVTADAGEVAADDEIPICQFDDAADLAGWPLIGGADGVPRRAIPAGDPGTGRRVEAAAGEDIAVGQRRDRADPARQAGGQRAPYGAVEAGDVARRYAVDDAEQAADEQFAVGLRRQCGDAAGDRSEFGPDVGGRVERHEAGCLDVASRAEIARQHDDGAAGAGAIRIPQTGRADGEGCRRAEHAENGCARSPVRCALGDQWCGSGEDCNGGEDRGAESRGHVEDGRCHGDLLGFWVQCALVTGRREVHCAPMTPSAASETTAPAAFALASNTSAWLWKCRPSRLTWLGMPT